MNKKILFLILTVIAGLVAWTAFTRMNKDKEVITAVNVVEDSSLKDNAPDEVDEDEVPDQVSEEDKE